MSVEVWGYCDAKCKHRVLTVDQTAELIQEMAANGFQVPEGFIPTTAVNSIVEQNTGNEIKLFVGTQAEYDAWTGDKDNTFAIISDDPTLKEILNRLDKLESAVKDIDEKIETIDERLVKLGFREGSITVSPLVTATLNKITRQGNYVIGKLAGTIYLNNGTYETIGTLPSDFLPPAEITQDIVLSSGNYGWGSVDINQHNGVITLFIRPGITVSSNTISFEIPFGYEAKPIS